MHRFTSLVAGVLLVLGTATSVGASSEAGAGNQLEHYAHHPLRVRPNASSSPTGLSPATIKSAYGFSTSSTAGAGKTIAIVDAYDDPTAESDLNVFSSQFGLPACTTANGCFKKVNQTGGTKYPRSDAGWALEIASTSQWAHAIAPGAKILLVEASSQLASRTCWPPRTTPSHASYVSNSWGGQRVLQRGSYDSHFSQSGVSFFVSSGDAGLPAEYPSASPNVISVGGTTLHFGGSATSPARRAGAAAAAAAARTRRRPPRSLVSRYAQVELRRQASHPGRVAGRRPGVGRRGLRLACATRGRRAGSRLAAPAPAAPMWAARSADGRDNRERRLRLRQ